MATAGNIRSQREATQQLKEHAGDIPTIFLGNQPGQSRFQASIRNENTFTSSTLGVPPVKRKPSRTDINPNNKVYLRRQSNSFSDIGNNAITATTTTPLTDRPQSSLDHDVNTGDLPSLVLMPFVPAPWLDFGKVVVGSKKSVTMMVENPGEVVQRLTMAPGCRMGEMGFSISQLDPLRASVDGGAVEPLVLAPRSKMELNISWTPLTVGFVRSNATLRTNTGPFKVQLQGRGESPMLPPESRGLSSSKKPTDANIRTNRDIGASTFNPKSSALKQSILGRSGLKGSVMPSSNSAGEYRTLPYVTNNEMYDEKWINKQERSFTQWLNYEYNVTVDTFSTKDPSSWSYYSDKLEFEHTRASACKMYQSFKEVLKKVDETIDKDRLQLRDDCNLVEDNAPKRDIIRMLLSFDMRWLVLGLETITGKSSALNPTFNTSMIAEFMEKTIFRDKQTEVEYQPHRILSNRPRYSQAMNRFILKRVFRLLLFLDQAKIAHLIPSDPCLFNKASTVKSCREILLTISRNYLKGETNIVKHLLYMGYVVVHTQTPLEEFDFTVKSLAKDLCDGVRLCRLVDLHYPEFSLCEKMKFPTLSKAHMQQNVSLALNALVKRGISLEGTRGGVVSPRDIVMGHREKTFGLLWKLILKWKVAVLLDLSMLEAEIVSLKAEYKRIHGVDQPERVDTVYFTSDQLSALLRWCQAIGCFYNLDIDNFTTSFGDARAFGALLSYYHPTLLDMSEMKNSAQFLEEYKQGLHQPELQLPEGNNGKGWFIDTKDIKDPITQAKEMDRFNYRLLHHKVQALGGVPISLRHADMSDVGVPDEKAVILFVTYLCARLMHLNKDIRAAKTIQRIWRRKHYGRKENSRIKAAIILQKHIRKNLATKRARNIKKQRDETATLIQARCRTYLVRTRVIQTVESIVGLQTHCRAFLVRKRFVELKWAALTMQRYYRGHVARIQYHEVLQEYKSIQSIQAQVRGHLVRKEFLMLRLAAEVVQSKRRALVEGRRVRERYLLVKDAAVVIQQHWRAIVAGRRIRQEYQQRRDLVVRMQAHIRTKLVRQVYQELLQAAVVLQRRWRQRVSERELLQRTKAANIIQAHWRSVIIRRHVQHQYQTLRVAAIKIQSIVRGCMFRRRLGAVIKIQRFWRAIHERRRIQYEYNELRWAAFVIQQRRRAYRIGQETRCQYLCLRQSALTVQSIYRGRMARQQAHLALSTVVGIQAIIRMRFTQWQFEKLRAAALIIQSRWRARQASIEQRSLYRTVIQASIIIQRRWRAVREGVRVREEYQAIRLCLIATQAHLRGVLVRKAIYEFRWAATVMQRRWRARIQGQMERRQFLEQWKAARTIQAAWRYRVQRKRIQAYHEERKRVMEKWVQITHLSISAIVIQRYWRRYMDRKYAALRELAATTIQGWWRRQLKERQVHMAELLTLMMQTHIRGFLARKSMAHQQHSIVRIQAWWRGCLVRRDCTAKINDARKRIEHANATAEEHMKLGNRTTMALNTLLTSGQLSAVLNACYHLDTVTRLSKNSCLRLVEHNAVNIIFQLIKSCNRSQPHMQVLKHALNIIENLSRDRDTIGSVFWAPEGMEILVDSAQAYRENEMVFDSVVTILLIHLEEDESRRRFMRAMTAEVRKLKGVLTVMERKVEREGRNKSMLAASRKTLRQLVASVNKLRRIIELLQ
ncbi:hypothetical protein BGZ51_005139 [Haplosporangium sp. Z 767]|nr:hypothetical protein BGZ51_005139 [Haplosporangium sp. Z 767]